MNHMDLAARAQMARKRAGYAKPAAAANAIGCSRPTVISWEDGTAKSIGTYLLDAARAYDVNPEWLRLKADDDGWPWSKTLHADSSDRTATRSSQEAAPNADALRTALEITERVLQHQKVSATAGARADIAIAVYEMIQEGRGIKAAERMVTRMLRAVGGVAPTT